MLGLALGQLVLLAACGAAASVEPRPPGYPPEQPQRPERLVLAAPTETDPQQWWAKNVYRLLPGDGIYGGTYNRALADAVVTATNERRSAYGLAPVQRLIALDRVAQAHAMDQAIRAYWSHRTPEGLSSHQRIAAAGAGTVSQGGENSSISSHGGASGAAIVHGLENSPGHRELLLDPALRFIGVGVYDFGPGENEHIVQLLVDLE